MKKLLLLAIAAMVFAACSKKSTPQPQHISIQTDVPSANIHYNVTIVETINSQSTTVLDTTVTGQFTYNYTAPAGANDDVNVNYDDTANVQPVITITDNNTPETTDTFTDTGGKFHFNFLFVVA